MGMNGAAPKQIYIRVVFWVAISCLLIAGGFIIQVLRSHDWNPHSLILERSADVSSDKGWGVGYDAQWHYRIAMDPLGSFQEMDLPAFRYQRIVFPLLTRLLSLGQVHLIPWSMIIVNLVGVFISSYAFAGLLNKRGASPWIVISWLLTIGFLLCLRLDLLEPLALGFSFAGWWIWEGGQKKFAVVLFLLAGLTKEVGLILPIVLGAWLALNKRTRQALFVWVGSLVPYGLWAAFLAQAEEILGIQVDIQSSLLFPFSGFASISEPTSRTLIVLWVVLPFIASGILAVLDIVKNGWTTTVGLDSLIVLGNVGFVSILPLVTWQDPIALFRTSLGGVGVILFWAAIHHRRWFAAALGLWLPSGAVMFVVPGFLLPA